MFSSTKQAVLAALSKAGDSLEVGWVPGAWGVIIGMPRAAGCHLILPANVHSGHPRYRVKSGLRRLEFVKFRY